ncbi:hypothetical protein B0H14DRAFT_3174408 [Mycena olivaceomarginata]|nr:hypothetical protein B0H14DRAFT_3174408 [Mycena olivaceomarginata]
MLAAVSGIALRCRPPPWSPVPLTPVALRALLAPARDPDPATRRAATRRAVYASVFTPQPNAQPNNDGAEVRAEGVRVQRVGEREDLSVVVGCVRFRFRFRVRATIYGGDRSEAGGIVGARGLFGRVQVQVGRKCARTEHTSTKHGSRLERHQNHPVLEPTYNPTLLARAPPLSADIAHLLGVSESSWKSHRIHVQLMAAQPPALEKYVARIQAIADSPDPSPLLAHAYVRYLGDLSGGQTIQRALAKAYGLTMGGAGLTFYAFKELRSAKLATQGEMKRIKDWQAAVMEEASRVFEFTGKIFKAVDVEKRPSKVVYDPDAPRTYSLASVSAVVIAVCAAHFLLTVGSFTGEKGYEKLIAVEEWFSEGGRRRSSSPINDCQYTCHYTSYAVLMTSSCSSTRLEFRWCHVCEIFLGLCSHDDSQVIRHGHGYWRKLCQ